MTNLKTGTPFADAVERAHRRAGGGMPYEPVHEVGTLAALVGLCETALAADEPDLGDILEAAEVLSEIGDRLRHLRDVLGDVAIEVDADDEKRAEIAALDAARASQ